MDSKIDRIKQQDMVDYLAHLGHHPAKIRGNQYWYICPFQGERTPSFKINRRLNRWYHFAMGKGGSIIDFGIQYFNCSIAEFLQRFDLLHISDIPPIVKKQNADIAPEFPVVVRSVIQLLSLSLLSYMKERGISIATAKRFCKQVNFSIGSKDYYAIGFENDKGGFELRNRLMKISSAPKSTTLIGNDTESLLIFEGFMDLLAYVEYQGPDEYDKHDYLVLNSTAFIETAVLIAGTYRTGCHYFDHDPTGDKCRSRFAEYRPEFADGSSLYRGFNDLNAWWETSRK